MENEEYITIDLRKLFFLLWKNVVAILIITVVCAALGYVCATFLIAPTYSASADMLVNNSQERADSMTITSSDLTASSNLVGTYSVILKSHNILEQVITDLGLDYTYDELEKMVSVDAVDSTQVMRITVENHDADVAMQIVDRIVDLAPDVIMDTVEAGSVKVVDSPWSTGEPVSPNVLMFTAVFGMLGFALCVGVIFLREMLNDTFKTEDDIRKILELPVLGIIPLENESSKRTVQGRV